MTSLLEIEAAVSSLSAQEFKKFSAWFSELEAQRWDKELEADIDNGLLDSLADEALSDFDQGLCAKL